MTTTAQSLKKALISLLDNAFDATVQKSNSQEYEDISPDFGHGEDAPKLFDNGLNSRGK